MLPPDVVDAAIERSAQIFSARFTPQMRRDWRLAWDLYETAEKEVRRAAVAYNRGRTGPTKRLFEHYNNLKDVSLQTETFGPLADAYNDKSPFSLREFNQHPEGLWAQPSRGPEPSAFVITYFLLCKPNTPDPAGALRLLSHNDLAAIYVWLFCDLLEPSTNSVLHAGKGMIPYFGARLKDCMSSWLSQDYLRAARKNVARGDELVLLPSPPAHIHRFTPDQLIVPA